MLRAGVSERIETPETLAQRAHDERSSLRELHPNVAELIEQRTAEIEKLGKPAIERKAAELRQEMGAETSDGLVRDAGSAARAAVRADAYALKMLAMHARYMETHRRTAPGARK